MLVTTHNAGSMLPERTTTMGDSVFVTRLIPFQSMSAVAITLTKLRALIIGLARHQTRWCADCRTTRHVYSALTWSSATLTPRLDEARRGRRSERDCVIPCDGISLSTPSKSIPLTPLSA